MFLVMINGNTVLIKTISLICGPLAWGLFVITYDTFIPDLLGYFGVLFSFVYNNNNNSNNDNNNNNNNIFPRNSISYKRNEPKRK